MTPTGPPDPSTPSTRGRMASREVVVFLRFWEHLADRTKKGDARKAWKRDLRRPLEALPADVLAVVVESARRRFDAQQASRASLATRAGLLLVFAGVAGTAAMFVAATLTFVAPIALILLAVVGAGLLYAAIATAVLAVRSQPLGLWEVPRLDLEDGTDQRSLVLADTVEVLAANDQNRATLANAAAYLDEAQRWALIGIVLIALLAPLSVLATAGRSAPGGVVSLGSPEPGASHSPQPPSGVTLPPAVTLAPPSARPRTAAPTR